jgi:membrane-associated protease RseP (regulator of RpoE activity)
LTIFFVSCVTTPLLQTPSGRPEVTLYGITKKQFFDAVAAAAAIDGRVIREVNDYNIVIAKKNTSFGAALLFGSSYDTTPEERTTLTVIEVPRGIRIFATCTIVTNPGSAFEKTTTSSNLRGIQAELEKLKANYGTENRQEQGYQTAAPQQKYVGRGWLGVAIQNMDASLAEQFGVAVTEGVLISDIQDDSPAEEAGFERGDILIEYDNKAMGYVNQLRKVVAQTEVGKDVKVKVLRKGNETVLTVKIGEQP